jgi:hypothetical protein
MYRDRPVSGIWDTCCNDPRWTEKPLRRTIPPTIGRTIVLLPLEFHPTMAAVLLDDLTQRISQQEAQLQALRRELETRQQHLAQLTQRKEQLLAQLQQIDAEIAGIAGGASAVKSSQTKVGATQTARPARIDRQPTGNGAVAQQAKSKPRSRTARTDIPRRRNGRAEQPTLNQLIVTLVAEAGRPVTVKEMCQKLKRRGYQSQSRNFPKMLAVRARELKKKGILRAAVGQPGFVPSTSKSRKGASPAHRRSKSHPQKSVTQPPLREVLMEILKKSTNPLTGSQLAAEARKAGYHSQSKSFVDVVWDALNKLPHVEHIPNQGYRLKKDTPKPVPQRKQNHRR